MRCTVNCLAGLLQHSRPSCPRPAHFTLALVHAESCFLHVVQHIQVSCLEWSAAVRDSGA